ncbi:hypothetical protein GGU11DRAFT_800618 [Lentinula aff. detonsa]|nr:hypothetical protein GGU11DRAFT_800618 [Lentinula aff. detonsa]
MLSLSRLLPGPALLVGLLVSILAVIVTAAPTVNESGEQVVKFVLARELWPLELPKYDEPWTSPSELDVGIRIGTWTCYYASRNNLGMIQIEPGPNSANGRDSANGLVIGKVKMVKGQDQIFWNHVGKLEYRSKLEFVEHVLRLLEAFGFEQNQIEALFQDHMVEKVKQLQM